MTRPLLLILRGAVSDAWNNGQPDEKKQVFEKWMRIHDKWAALGADLVGTLDDVMSMCGLPSLRLWNFYEIYEIPSADTVQQMLNLMREAGPEGVRVDRYFRYEAVVGPRVAAVEERLLPQG